jgi:hypothetical protein
MNLYLISQTENEDYDTYDSAVVCAPDEDTARRMDPDRVRGRNGKAYDFGPSSCDWWCSSADLVEVRLIGKAAPDVHLGVVCASFNKG